MSAHARARVRVSGRMRTRPCCAPANTGTDGTLSRAEDNNLLILFWMLIEALVEMQNYW